MSEVAPVDMFNQQRLHQMVTDILDEAKRQGATSAEVDVTVNKGFNVMVRKGDVESVEYNQDKVIEITGLFWQTQWRCQYYRYPTRCYSRCCRCGL